MIRIAVPLIGLMLALAACKGEEKPAQDARAAGEILPGSASDAMIPYDTVRSEPPLAPPPVASGRPGPRSGEGEDAQAAEPEVAASDAPAIDIPAPAVAPSGE